MGLASAQVEFGSNPLLGVCLTELIIDTLQEKKHLHEVLLSPQQLTSHLKTVQPINNGSFQVRNHLSKSVLSQMSWDI